MIRLKINMHDMNMQRLISLHIHRSARPFLIISLVACLCLSSCDTKIKLRDHVCWKVIARDTSVQLALLIETHFRLEEGVEPGPDFCDARHASNDNRLARGNHLHVIKTVGKTHEDIVLLPEAFVHDTATYANDSWPGMADEYRAEFTIESIMGQQMAWLRYETIKSGRHGKPITRRYRWLIQMQPFRQVLYLQELAQMPHYSPMTKSIEDAYWLEQPVSTSDSTITTQTDTGFKKYRWNGKEFAYSAFVSAPDSI